LTEQFAEHLRFDALAERLPGPNVYPPYLLVATGILIEYGILDPYSHFVAGEGSFITNPSQLAIPAMAVIAVVGARYIHDSYAEAIEALGIKERDDGGEPNAFEGLLSLRLRLGVYLLVLIGVYVFEITVIGFPTLLVTGNLGRFVYWRAITFPLIVLPPLIEFGLSYFAVHIAVPRRLLRADIGLFFYDPRNMGGFGPIGELLKRTYYLYTAVLLLYFVQTHAPVILERYIDSPYPAPGPFIQVLLSIGWLVGLLTIAYSMYRVHSIMKADKEERISELESELKDIIDAPYDIHTASITDREAFETIERRLERVRATKTYPTTFAMWSQIFISVLLPQALNLVVQIPG
jgi:hypothetical protein